MNVWDDLAGNGVIAARCWVVRLVKEIEIKGVPRRKGMTMDQANHQR